MRTFANYYPLIVSILFVVVFAGMTPAAGDTGSAGGNGSPPANPGTATEEQTTRASINGFIRDADNGETLMGATILLMDTSRGATTNHSGYYIVNNIPPGTYTVRFSYLGYNEKRVEVTLEAGDGLRIDIDLEPAEFVLDELVVTSAREREERQNIGTASVSTELIKSVPSVLQADVFRSVQLLPGVKAASDFSSGLYIRGGGPDQTLILLDRTTVYNPSHFFGFFSTFNPDAIKDVRLYKGAYPASYGGRLGSVLDVYNKDGNRYETRGSLSLGMLSSRAMIEGPYSRGSYMLAVRRSTLEPLLAALRTSVDNVPHAFYFYDINAKINYDHWDNNRLSIAAYTGTDKVRFPFGDDSQFNLFYGNRTLSIDWTHLLSRRTFTNITITGSEYFNDPAFEFGGTDFERQNRIYDISAKADLEWIPSGEFELLAGFWGGRKTFRLRDYFDDQMTMDERIGADYGSLYLQNIWRPRDRWIINAGLRANYFSSGDYFRLDPRLSVEYYLTPETRLQAAYGRYHQFLTLLTNEAISAFDLWLITDTGVPPAYGDQFVLGVKNSSLPGYNFEFELYYRTMRDLFEFDPFLADAAGLDYAELFRFGEGYAAGFETFLEKTRGRLYGFIGYTWGITRRKFEGFNRDRFYPPKYDRIHDINVVANYQLSSRWTASAVFNYATGQAYTEPLGRTALSSNPFDGGTVDAIVVGRVNASRLPAYHRLDIGFTRQSSFFGIAESEWQFQAINLYSRRNVWFYMYDFDENPVKREEATMLPIIPVVGYTIHF
ncbi:TonB-dependent receptor [Balneolales bacterium ANBcel1]|nr:TonB-dependent receptor [Balneolales bacterium ANBcel1]